MFRHRSDQSKPPNGKGKLPKKLIGGFAALAATAIITAGGLAAAAPNDKPTKEQCKQAGFPNYGQCVKEWAHHKNHPGGGYGGGNTSVVTNIDLQINNSNNNIIQVIVNIFR